MNYELIKSKKTTNKSILFLHGWGSNLQTMKCLNVCDENYNLLFVDLPGCGKSKEPEKPLQYEDYLEKIENQIKDLTLEVNYIVGHSFGGKIAIGLTQKITTLKGLFLISPSIIKPKRKLDYYLKIYTYKTLKKLDLLKFLNPKLFGSSDYKNASEVMKKTLVNVVNIYFDEELKKINLPTILLWAKDDEQTPFYMANIAKKQLINSEIIPLQGSHFAYYHQSNLTKKILLNFILGVDKNASD